METGKEASYRTSLDFEYKTVPLILKMGVSSFFTASNLITSSTARPVLKIMLCPCSCKSCRTLKFSSDISCLEFNNVPSKSIEKHFILFHRSLLIIRHVYYIKG